MPELRWYSTQAYHAYYYTGIFDKVLLKVQSICNVIYVAIAEFLLVHFCISPMLSFPSQSSSVHHP